MKGPEDSCSALRGKSHGEVTFPDAEPAVVIRMSGSRLVTRPTEPPTAVRASSSDVAYDKEVEDVSNLEDTQSAHRQSSLFDLVKRESEALILSLSSLWG